MHGTMHFYSHNIHNSVRKHSYLSSSNQQQQDINNSNLKSSQKLLKQENKHKSGLLYYNI